MLWTDLSSLELVMLQQLAHERKDKQFITQINVERCTSCLSNNADMWNAQCTKLQILKKVLGSCGIGDDPTEALQAHRALNGWWFKLRSQQVEVSLCQMLNSSCPLSHNSGGCEKSYPPVKPGVF